MTEYAKVENNPHLVRDLDSKAILNTDNGALKAYKAKKRAQIQTEQRIDNIERKLDLLLDMLTRDKV